MMRKHLGCLPGKLYLAFLERFPDGDVGQMTFSGGGQAAIECDAKRPGLGIIVSELGRSPVRTHGVRTGWAGSDAI